MSTEPPDEGTLAAALAPYVADLEPAPDLYAALRRRRRRRRTLTGGGLASATALAVAGTLVATNSMQHHTQPAAPHPVFHGVRGSLGGDQALIAQARALCVRPDPRLARLPGRTTTLKPSPPTIQVAERLGNTTVVMGYWTLGSSHSECLMTRTGSGPLKRVSYAPTVGDSAAFDASYGQLFYGDSPVLVQSVKVDNHRLLLVAGPVDARAQLRTGLAVTAQAQVRPDTRPLPLHDGGVALIEGTGFGQGVTITQGGRVLADVPDANDPPSAIFPDTAEENAMRSGARGQVDENLMFNGLFDDTLIRLGQRERSFSVLWGGTLPDNSHAMLFAARFASGASYLWELTGDAGSFTKEPLGLVPVGAADHWALAWKDQFDRNRPVLVVVGPPGTARAEARLAGGRTVPVPVHDGGGAIAWPGTVTSVSVYGPGGQLLDSRGVKQGMVDPGLDPDQGQPHRR